MSVGKRIKMYITENNISQVWLSAETKISLPKLNASLNGHRKLSADEFASIIITLNEDANKFIKN